MVKDAEKLKRFWKVPGTADEEIEAMVDAGMPHGGLAADEIPDATMNQPVFVTTEPSTATPAADNTASTFEMPAPFDSYNWASGGAVIPVTATADELRHIEEQTKKLLSDEAASFKQGKSRKRTELQLKKEAVARSILARQVNQPLPPAPVRQQPEPQGLRSKFLTLLRKKYHEAKGNDARRQRIRDIRDKFLLDAAEAESSHEFVSRFIGMLEEIGIGEEPRTPTPPPSPTPVVPPTFSPPPPPPRKHREGKQPMTQEPPQKPERLKIGPPRPSFISQLDSEQQKDLAGVQWNLELTEQQVAEQIATFKQFEAEQERKQAEARLRDVFGESIQIEQAIDVESSEEGEGESFGADVQYESDPEPTPGVEILEEGEIGVEIGEDIQAEVGTVGAEQGQEAEPIEQVPVGAAVHMPEPRADPPASPQAGRQASNGSRRQPQASGSHSQGAMSTTSVAGLSTSQTRSWLRDDDRATMKHQQYSPAVFISKAAFKRYQHRRPIIYDKGFLQENLSHPMIADIIESQEWQEFALHYSEKIPLELIREFFANLDPDMVGRAVVRGVEVNYSGEVINELYRLRPPFVWAGKRKVIGARTQENATIMKAFTGNLLSQAELRDAVFSEKKIVPSLWPLLDLFNAKIKPTTHMHTQTVPGLYPLYRAILGGKLNMGAVIAGNIFEKLRDIGAPLCYPGLVKRLCERAGVPMQEFAGDDQPHFTMDPPIPIPDGITRFDPELFVQMPEIFGKDVGTSEYDRMQPKVWPKRTPKPSYLMIIDEEGVEEIRGQEAGPSVPRTETEPAPAPATVPAATVSVPASSQTVTQPRAAQSKRRLESSEGSRSTRQRKQAPKRVRTSEEIRVEEERRKKAAFAARFNVADQMTRRREERQAREANIIDMTIPAVDASPSPPPTIDQATTSVPPSAPSSRTIPAIQQDPGATALQLVYQLMEMQQKREEEERVRRVEEAQAKERRRLEKERQKIEELKKAEEIRKEELRRVEEATQAEIRRVEELRREEMRVEREARAKFEETVHLGLQQTTNVLAALFEKVSALGAAPITGPIPPSQQALPSRAGEGTSGTGTTASDTPAAQESDPPTQSQRSDKDGSDKEKSAD